ncbi:MULTISPECIES: EAL domain-containing protein [unclassified Massilia]|uniref:EAL domain-containing protein n=1 Tax=unclassified Massilia TaxID=2609279 RepID=UPI00177CDE36|nr:MULTISPECIES: EAL domain-containing protein [unclassified Massilia]MBD8532441.1 EAL domain-containing protein [Massilia sp. CFBP 13647]MBD8675733.1 EAL domain-containing protein [Massilia sp. CFBP 13721]
MDSHAFRYPRWSWQDILLANLSIVAAYFGTGLLFDALSLPSGYALPLFPPAGIGLALATAGGMRVLPGVALGAALANLPLHQANPAFTAGAALAATCASLLGALLQAWLGARQFRRRMRPAIDSGRDVIAFLLITPLVCLTSASIVVPALSALGAVSAADRWHVWFAWWAGDTLGVLLAAPLCWIVCGSPRRLWRRRAVLVALPLLITSTAVLVIYRLALGWEHEQHLQPYRLKAQQTADLLQSEFNEHVRFVGTFSSTLAETEHILARDKFLRIAAGYADGRPEIEAMNWMVPVTGLERPGFEDWVKRTLDPLFAGIRDMDGVRLIAAAERERYLPVLYAWPTSHNVVRGVDYLAAPGRAAVAARVLVSRAPLATEPFRLLERDGPGIALMRAVGDPTGPPAGVVAFVLNARLLLAQAIRRAGFDGFNAALVDVTDGAALPVAGALGTPRRDDYRVPLSFAGRSYVVSFRPTAAYMDAETGAASWTVLSAGLLLTGLLGALLLLISGERDVIEKLVADRTARLRDREARLQAILDNAADAIITVDAAGMVVSANAATAGLFGYPPQHLIGLPFGTLVPAGAHSDANAQLGRLSSAPPEEAVLEGFNAQGEPFPLAISVAPVDLEREVFFVCILRDLTEQQRAQERIYRLAHHDALTGLENRFALNVRLEHQLAAARRHNAPVAVLFIDLDHFKKINDSLGHAAGDKLLVGAAERMKDLLREVDTLARLGGDEFIIVLAGPLTPDSVTSVAVRVVESLSQPYQLNGATAHSGCSVGVALFPDDGEDASTLIRHADMAMYAAKREGRGNFQFFSPEMNAATHEHLLLENRMWSALSAEGFELYLQAQVELDTGRVIGAEVLLRWNDQELGSVEPSRFIPVAEESGMIVPLGDWVLGQTMALLAQWQREGLDELRLAVNLSARQFSGSSLLSRLDELVAKHGIDPSLMELEITETAAMRDPEATRQLLRQLRTRGFKLAIDDFGTGYSSLAYLKLFAIDRIKIDRGFVKDIEHNPNDAVIVAATIGLAHSLGLTVVAEGVETEAQWGFLRDKRGDEAQGYLFARPMPAHEFREFIRRQAQPVPDA